LDSGGADAALKGESLDFARGPGGGVSLAINSLDG